MLTGTSVMDAALLVISANERRPQAQALENLTAMEAIGMEDVVAVQNTIDCVGVQGPRRHDCQVRRFPQDTVVDNAPIIPTSAQLNINAGAILDKLTDIKLRSGDEPLFHA
jgi:translation initiation factor 2 subunit 3